jgi:catechol 2,3-dioxygenase-like lactoylglutathione lyase family enzyme
MKIKLATVNLETAHPQISKRFYIDGLGMREELERSHGEGFVYLTSDGCDLTLATPEHASAAEPSRTMEIGFEVDDIAEARARLAAAGFSDVSEKSMGWGEVLETHDGDGYRVILYRFTGG